MADRTHIEEVEEQAALFALGALPPEEAKQFERRLAADCPLCRAEFNGCKRAVAALALNVSEITPPPRARARLLDALPGRRVAGPSRMGAGTLVRADDTEWETSPVPGVELRRLHHQKTVLVRMSPKTSYPARQHPQAEQCLVLEGSITSEGVTAYAGDFTYMPAGSSHHPLYSENGCLLLIAYS